MPLPESTPTASPRLRVEALASPHGDPYDLQLSVSECVSIFGRSGSGKSVLLRLIADLDPNTGEVHLDGRARSSWPAPQWRHRVVYQAAEPAWWEVRRGLIPLINQMSAEGIITLPGIMTGQLLAGMDPIEAVKYQILLLFLLTGAGAMAAAGAVLLAARSVTDDRQRLRLDRLRTR